MRWEMQIDEECGDFVARLHNGDINIEGRGETLPDALREAARETQLAEERGECYV